MECVVIKFGGTSLGTAQARKQVIQKIKRAKEDYKNLVVVVSAMGRLGHPYATDSLLDLVAPSQAIHPQEKDMLMACGEIIASVKISSLLKEQGIEAMALTGGQAGILTDDTYNNGQVLAIDKQRLEILMKENIIPVVAGFQGVSEEGNITTLGRGGSDTTAALLGEVLGAKQIEIYTDVDGIMTADPRVCKKAKTIKEISYNEVFQMADSGAKVIHPRAVEIARRAGIPLIIRNTFSTSEGTNICHCIPTATYGINDRLITGIAHRNERVQVIILSSELNEEAFFYDLARSQVSIDIINIFPEQKVFTIDNCCKNKVLDLIAQYGLAYKMVEDCSKVTVIGERMTGVPGVMAKIIHSLGAKGIKILQTADSLSTIACLIKTEDVEEAVSALHEEFLLATE